MMSHDSIETESDEESGKQPAVQKKKMRTTRQNCRKLSKEQHHMKLVK
jgi:hypothetical protein